MKDKKEIKKLYKQTVQPMGIYQITNLANGKFLIGKSTDLQGKLNSEKFQLKNNLPMNRELQNDFNDLGEEKFSFEILNRLLPKEKPDYDYDGDLQALKEMWLEKLQPFAEKGYNKKKP